MLGISIQPTLPPDAPQPGVFGHLPCLGVFWEMARLPYNYLMAQQRKRPDFNREEIFFVIRQGVFCSVLSLIGLLLGLLLLIGALINKHWVYLLLSIFFTAILALQLWMCLKEMFLDGFAQLLKRKRWLINASRAEIAIVDRRYEVNEYAESREEYTRYELALQRTLDEPPFWVTVSEKIFYRYQFCKSAWIYSSKTEPDQFILEGE